MKKKENRQRETFTAIGLLKDILSLVFFVLLGFCWMLLMLLIISFVAQSAVHFKIEVMLMASAGFAVCVGIFHIYKTIRKYI